MAFAICTIREIESMETHLQGLRIKRLQKKDFGVLLKNLMVAGSGMAAKQVDTVGFLLAQNLMGRFLHTGFHGNCITSNKFLKECLSCTSVTIQNARILSI